MTDLVDNVVLAARLGPNDLLVCRMPPDTEHDTAERFRADLARALGIGAQRIIVVYGVEQLTVIDGQ